MRTYVRGDGFLGAFNGLDAGRRETVMLVYAQTHAACEAKAKLPLLKPVPLNARTRKNLTNWRDPVMMAKLANAYARAQDDEGAARILGVTSGAARLARRRYLGHAAAPPRKTAYSGPQTGDLVSGPLPRVEPCEASVRRS